MYGEESETSGSDQEYQSGSETSTVDDGPIIQDSILFPKHLDQLPTTTPLSALPPLTTARVESSDENEEESAAQIYGEQETRHLNIGGSRPSSRLDARSPVDSPLVSPIPASSGLDYLYLHDSTEQEALPQIKNLDARKARLGIKNSTASRFNSLRGSVYEVASPRQSYSQVASIYGNYAEGEAEGVVDESSVELNSEESWVLLRALVGEELTRESGLLWKLSSTDRLEVDMKSSSDIISNSEIPILRYLIKNFLLKLPMIKSENPSALPPFWTDGLLPLIKAYHDADLSHSIDQGFDSLATTLGGKLKTAVERCIANGIILSSSSAQSERESPATIVPTPRRNNVVKRSLPVSAVAPRIASLPPADPIFRRFSLATLFARTKSPSNGDPTSPVLDSPSPRFSSESPVIGRNSFGNGARRDWIDESESSSVAEEREVLNSDTEDDEEANDTITFSPSSKSTLPPLQSADAVDPSVSEYDDDDDTSTIAQNTEEDSLDHAYLAANAHLAPPLLEKDRKVVNEGEKMTKSRLSFLRPKQRSSISDVPVLDQPAASRQLPSSLFESTPTRHDVPTRVHGSPKMYESKSNSQPRPTSTLPLSGNVVARTGVSWPWEEPVAFWRGMPLHQLRWGGFEADVVGVRRTLLGHAFIIRVRRPKRLDEIVIRTEAQFLKYYKRLDKAYPSSHVRPIPSTPGAKDDAIPVTVTNSPLPRPTSTPTPLPSDEMETLNLSRRTSSRQSQAFTAVESTTSLKKTKSGRFATELQRQSSLGESRSILANGSNGTEGGAVASAESVKTGSASHDAQRRALRTWLRDTLAIHSVGHDNETAAFLLLGSIVPKKQDTKDIVKRALIDERRQTARVAVAQTAPDRARTAYDIWTSVKDECVNGDGFRAMSEALRAVDDASKLPERFVKSIDWMRYGLAESLFDILVAAEDSTLFDKIKSLHAVFPWFLLRQVMKLGPDMMIDRLQDLLLARPFGAKSLLQKIIGTVLDDEPEKLQRQIDSHRARIGSATACQKIDLFVNGDREQKDVVRRFAASRNLELAICIVRGADVPRLSAFELDRVIVAEADAKKFLKTNPTALEKSSASSTNLRFYFDLIAYLRLTSRQRDAAAIRQLLGKDATTEALQACAAPLIDLLKRVYKVGQLSNALVDLQQFLDQLIVVVEALRARIQNPDVGVRLISRLLARYQQPLWAFTQKVHRGDTIVEELLQWFSSIADFSRHGLEGTVTLDDIVPTTSQERSAFLDEMEDLVDFHYQKRSRQYQNLCRKFAGDIDGDDPIIVEGDGNGRSRVAPLLDPAPPAPRTTEISRYSSRFRSQLGELFSV